MKWWLLASLPLSCLITGCSSDRADTETTAAPLTACEPVDAAACPPTMPSFANDVVPILNRDCNGTCHAPGMGQWPLVSYTDVSDWAILINLDLEDCAMPPADAGIMTRSDRATVLAWIACRHPDN